MEEIIYFPLNLNLMYSLFISVIIWFILIILHKMIKTYYFQELLNKIKQTRR